MATGLVSVALGCGSNNSETNKPEQQGFYFEHFGVIYNISSQWDNRSSLSIGIGDMDGDGDNDIVLADRDGQLIIYENKMPQKKTYSGPAEAQEKK